MDNNMMADGVISLDERPALSAVSRYNKGLDDTEQKTKTVMDRTGRLWEVMGDVVVRTSDKSKTSLDRLLQSMQKQADLAGKSGVEKLIVQRDQLIARWQKEQTAVEAITRSYDKQIEAARKLEQEQRKLEESEQRRASAQSVAGWMQDPYGKGKESLSALLAEMGAAGGVMLGTAAALGAVSVAGFEAAKSLGEYGVQVRDVKERTGLTTKEVGQFAFAARVAGQDVSVFERMMRGLTMAIEDDSEKGEKARVWLRRFGVDIGAVRDGTASTSEVFQQIARGLSELGNTFEQKKAALDLFKKAGIETIPVMMELNENLKVAREKDYGLSDDDLDRYLKYQKSVAIIEASWGRIVRHIKEFLVPSFEKRVPQPPEPNAGFFARVKAWMGGGGGGFLGLGDPEDSGTLPRPMGPPPLLPDDRELDSRVRMHVAQLNEQMKEQRDAAKKLETERHALLNQAHEFEKRGDEAELTAVGKIYYERDRLIQQAEKLKVAEADIAAIRQSAAKQAMFEVKKDIGATRPVATASTMNYGLEGVMSPEEIKTGEKALADITALGYKARLDMARQQGAIAQKGIALSGATGADAIQADYQIRVALARELARIEDERISKENIGLGKIYDQLDNQSKLQKAMDEAHEDAVLKQLEIQKQRTDLLKKESEGLWHTLLTNPSQFGKQLTGTVREALVKPVSDGLATMTANVLKPVIYGADGQGGISGFFKGMFGGQQQDPMKMATDMNTAVTAQNSVALATLTAMLAGMMGVAAPSIAAPAGLGELSVPGISAPAVSGSAATSSAGYVGGSAVDGGPSFEALANLPMRSGGSNPLASILGSVGRGGSPAGGASGAYGGSGFNFGGILKSIKGINLGGLTRTPSRWSMDENGNMTELSAGKINGVNGLMGAALSTGGMMLGQYGLLGSARGTWGGVAAGAVGGAMIGFQAAGPLGALIGGGAGLLAGIGEKIAGVETPENEAKRLVKQVYELSIDNNTAKQIVAIAQQKYGNTVSVAVRSPEVRQLLQLFAESSGKKSNLFLSNPQGASFVESGRNLYQTAVYNDGTPYTYASNLPVMGPAGGPIPTGNPFLGSGSVTVTVSPEQTANLWATGVAAGIAGSPRQVADSAVNGGTASSARIKSSLMQLAPGMVTS